jgi:RNA polymerase sigma-70 factor (ECF subfamily)
LLDKAIAELPPQRRAVFELCKLKEKTYDEVARKMNISRSTVQDHIVKANKFIREYLLMHGNFSFAVLFTILSLSTNFTNLH